MKRLLMVFWVLALVLPGGVQAQDSGEPLKCSDQDTAAALQTAIDTLTAAQDQDAAAQYAAAVEAKVMLAALDSVCLGLDFEGVTATVHDPIYIPAGLYRVTATTSGFFILQGTILDGSCDEEYAYFNLMMDRATTGAQITFESQGCTMLWETSNISAPYSVTFEKLK
jgi:hypothetical protein